MLIDIRYDIELAPGAPTALIYRLRVDPNREQDLQAPEPVQVQSGLQTREYFDTFDHRCSRIQVPAGGSAAGLTNRARYVTAYRGEIGLPPVRYPTDFSAWFEVCVGDQWYAFDPRHNTPRVGGIVMARRRDGEDAPITMTFGTHPLTRFEVTTDEVV